MGVESTCPSSAPTTCASEVVASALNHMDLWVTRGLPKPPLPHVPGCDVAGVVDAVGQRCGTVVGDEVVVNPGVSPVADIVALGNDSPMGPGFAIYGEHTWGGHATLATAPARNVVPARPAGPGRSARRIHWRRPDCLPDAAPGSAAGRPDGARRRHRLGVSCAALAIARHLGAEVAATSRSEAKRAEALAMGRRGHRLL